MKTQRIKRIELKSFLKKKSPILLLAFVLLGCAIPISSVVYQNPKIPQKPIKAGYSQFTYEEKNEFRGNGSIRAYDSTMATILIENQIAFTKIHIPAFKELDDATPDYIRRLCEKHGLDGIFLTQLQIEAVHESHYQYSYAGTSVESEVDMQFVSREGDLISHTHSIVSTQYGNGINEKACFSVARATEDALSNILKNYK